LELAEYLPAAQLEQPSAAKAEYVPALQMMQSVALDWDWK
jgi:hypothetical protein